MKYRLAIFDFDGTLADSFPFFVSVFNTLAVRHGFKQIDSGMVAHLRHYHARQIRQHVELPAWKLPIVVTHFIALMRHHVGSIPLFPHVRDMLRHLSHAGVQLAVVTSNSYSNVGHILGPDVTQMIHHFECGMSIFGKAARIKKVLRQTAIPAREALYIGDQVTDLEAARKAGVAFGAVAWGYGTLESLKKYSPEEEFSHVAAITGIA